jgi:hypothetical protein
MYERKNEPLLSRQKFLRRVARHGCLAGMLFLGSLAIGMAGYHWIEGMAWIDSFVNAAMLLGGMGPIGELHTFAGKLFAGCFAMYAGLLLLTGAGVLLAPVFHRVMHRLQLESSHSKE